VSKELKADSVCRGGGTTHGISRPRASRFTREGERYRRPRLLSLGDGDALVTPLVPGLETPLALVFAD
jgi:hypothetical protein